MCKSVTFNSIQDQLETTATLGISSSRLSILSKINKSLKDTCKELGKITFQFYPRSTPYSGQVAPVTTGVFQFYPRSTLRPHLVHVDRPLVLSILSKINPEIAPVIAPSSHPSFQFYPRSTNAVFCTESGVVSVFQFYPRSTWWRRRWCDTVSRLSILSKINDYVSIMITVKCAKLSILSKIN